MSDRAHTRMLMPLALAAVAAFALYVPALSGGFLSDDVGILVTFYGRPVGDVAAEVARMFVSGVGPPSNQYRPLTMLSFAVNALVSGADPGGWRVVNVLLHAANTALVALIALRLAGEDRPGARWAALAAALAFAWFPPGVEAVAWIAARFDGMALFWTLVAAWTFLRSRVWHDRWGLTSLAATVLAFTSKESAAIAPLLIVALAWAEKTERRGLVRDVAAAIRIGAPWIGVAVAYAALRLSLFGDAVRFFPGTSPIHTLVTGAWIVPLIHIGDWWALAVSATWMSRAFAVASFALALCALAASVNDASRTRAVVAVALTVIASLALVLSHGDGFPARGEGGRLLYAIAAVAALAVVVPLGARSMRLRAVSWIVVAALLSSELALARATVERRARAGADMRALVAAIAQVADSTPPGSFSFVVVPDHVGSVPFARNAQGGLMLPPIQPRPLAPQLIVQLPSDLSHWPDLLERDIIGRLRREPLADVSANPMTPKVAPPHAMPDRYFCWSERARSMVELHPAFAPDLRDWDATWARVLDAAGCT